MIITRRNPFFQMVAADIGLWSIDLVTNEIFLCDRAKLLIGISNHGKINVLAILKLIDPSHKLNIVNLVQECRVTGQRFRYEYPVYRQLSNEPVWLQINGQLQQNGPDKSSEVIGTLKDITEKKRRDLLKDDLLAMLSHELKAPLSTIRLYVQLVRNKAKKANDLQAADLLYRADSQVTEMNSIIENILDMSLIASGKITLQTQRFDMSELIQEVVGYLFQQVKTHRISVISEGLQLINADRSKIKQVIYNLLSNAVKYSPEQSHITISSRWNGDQFQVSVEDKGLGISSKHQEKLFHRFYRAECADVKNKKGYGIGLYIVKEIIREHQGIVWVDSEEGAGTIFYFSLPHKRSNPIEQ